METKMKHLSLDKRKIEELQEIAEREGRKDYDLVRQAVAQFLNDTSTDSKVHPVVPEDGVVRPGDRAIQLNFDEMWTDDAPSISEVEEADVVRAIEDSGTYFTYYKFVYMDGHHVAQTVAPISYQLLEQLNEKVDKYQV
jgi:hypothetical protein